MNNELTADDLSDLAAIKAGATNPDGSRRNLRVSELEDLGVRLFWLGLVNVRNDHLSLTEAGEEKLAARAV